MGAKNAVPHARRVRHLLMASGPDLVWQPITLGAMHMQSPVIRELSLVFLAKTELLTMVAISNLNIP